MHNVLLKQADLQEPVFQANATLLAKYLKSLSVAQIQSCMAVSPQLADTTHQLLQSWSNKSAQLSVAIDSFAGDIYSGLQAHNWSLKDRQYANSTLRILSGLYGILKPLDCIHPYRLEMGYRLPDPAYKNLYKFWQDKIAQTISLDEPIVNLAAVEYSKVVIPYVDPARIITPRFLTRSPKTGEPTFVVVHTKIARGAFANWIVRNRISQINEIYAFSDLGYYYEGDLSKPNEPVFVCESFQGLGLSVRLRNK